MTTLHMKNLYGTWNIVREYVVNMLVQYDFLRIKYLNLIKVWIENKSEKYQQFD